MISHKNGSLENHKLIEHHRQQTTNDRRGLIGLFTIFSLAFPALAIRYLYPDLNPLFLVGLGLAVYVFYLGFQAYYSLKLNDVELATKPVLSNSKKPYPLNEERY